MLGISDRETYLVCPFFTIFGVTGGNCTVGVVK